MTMTMTMTMNFPSNSERPHCTYRLLLMLFQYSWICHHSVNGIAYNHAVNTTTTNRYNNNYFEDLRWREQISINRQFLTRKGRQSLTRKDFQQQQHNNNNSTSSNTDNDNNNNNNEKKKKQNAHAHSYRRTNSVNHVRGKQQYHQYQQQQHQKERKSQRELQASSKGPILNVLVCLMQWTNHPNRNEAIPAEDYRKLFNGEGRDPELFPGGSVGDYFKTMSYGDFQINFEVTDWIMTEYTEQQFTAGGSQGRTQELQEAFAPVLQHLDDDYFDFGLVDANYDRTIDLTIFVHSGYDGVIGAVDCETGATSQQRIASHARAGADMSTWTSAGGYKLGPYAVVPAFRGVCDLQIGRIGTIVHETIHTFGLPEMYDTEGNYNTGNLGGIDRFGVMANAAGNSGGNLAWPGHVGAWSRLELGWVDPIVIDKDGTYDIRPIEKYPDLYKITKGFANEKEYLLLENRQSIAGDFDEKFFTPGGIVIYHVDENIWDVFKNEFGPKGNFPRGGPFQDNWPGNGKHYPVAILQADGKYELEQGINGGQNGDGISNDLWNKPTQILGPGNGEKVAKQADYPNTDSYAFGLISPTGITIRNFQTIPGEMKSMSFQVCGIDGDDCPKSTTVPQTKAPIELPTKAPTPVVVTTLPPTKAPTLKPVEPPSIAPTLPLTKAPTPNSVASPTVVPTRAPIIPSKSPTNKPINDNIFQPAVNSSETSKLKLLSNGNCQNAEPAFSIDTTVKRISNIAYGKNYETCDGTEKQGVWYTIGAGSVPSNATIQANTCFDETEVMNSISVYRGDNCSILDCVETDTISCKNGGLGHVVYWTAAPQENYFLFVHAVNNTGADKDMNIISDNYNNSVINEDANATTADTDDVYKFSNGSLYLNVLDFPQILNDDCDNAVTAFIDVVIEGTTAGARPETKPNDAPCGIESAGVWYKVTGTGRSLRATTCLPGTNHATQIHVFSGSCESLSCISVEANNYIACSNPLATSTYSATVNWYAEKDNEYFVLVGSRDGSIGNFELEITPFDPVSNDQCSDATSLSLDSQISGSTTDATVDFPFESEHCGLSLDTVGVWYLLEGTGNGMSFTTCTGNDYNSAVSIFTGSDCNNLKCLTGVATRDPSCDYAGVTAAWMSEINETYYVYVHGIAQNSYGTFEGIAKDFLVVEANEFCPQAKLVTEDEHLIQASTKNATHSAPTNTCGVDAVNPGLWYTFNGTGNTTYEISACARDDTDAFDASVSLFSGDSCGQLKCVSGYTFTDQLCSSTDGEESGISSRLLQNLSTSLPSISLDSEEDMTYYIFVHGQDSTPESSNTTSNGVGDFDLIIRSQIPPTNAPTVMPTAQGKLETDVDKTNKNENSDMDLNYLYLLLLPLLILPLGFFRKKICYCLPSFKDKEERNSTRSINVVDQEEVPFQDEAALSENKRKISHSSGSSDSSSGSDSDSDSDDAIESQRETESPLVSQTVPWQTLK